MSDTDFAGRDDATADVHATAHLVGLGTTTPLDGVAALAADLVDADVAMVSIVGREHEFLLGTAGIVGARLDGPDSLPLEGSICTVVRRCGMTTSVDDVLLDDRLSGDELRRKLGIRACAGAPVRTDDGAIVGAVCVGSTTPRHWTTSDLHSLECLARFSERELVRAVDSVAALDRAAELALMVGRLRHELSGDLTVVLGGIETALHPSASEEIRTQALTNARSDALRVIDVMDALLRTDARTSVRPRITSLQSIIAEATRALDDTTKHRVSISVDDISVELPGRLLMRVVANLVGNALKHSPGGVLVSARAADDVVVVSVADEGPGFRSDALSQLFKPFTTAHDPGVEGFGLGLFIVRELVDRLDGEINVHSSDRGATVTVTAPARIVPEARSA